MRVNRKELNQQGGKWVRLVVSEIIEVDCKERIGQKQTGEPPKNSV